MRWISLFSLLLLMATYNLNAQTPAFTLQVKDEQKGLFVQEKHLKVLSQPFVTKGNYHYQQNMGLTWHTKQPIESELNITTEGVKERQANGHYKTLTNNAQFSELLLALFSGEQQQLQQQFILVHEKNSLTLTPKEEQISKVILKITLLLNNDGIQQIILYEPDGNYTNIFLSDSSSHVIQD